MYQSDPVYAAVEAFVDELQRTGVQHGCVCPGARSTPLALVLAARPGLRAWSHIDERSAAFFALGIAKATRRPVAIVCTSGTAAANFLPAVIEAAYAHVPLLVLTADRPAELRDCGAPQTIDQLKLYGSQVKWFAEAAGGEAGARYFRALAGRAVAAACTLPQGPVHINFPFREPLVPQAWACDTATPATAATPPGRPQTRMPQPELHAAPETVAGIAQALAGTARGLIACGPFDADEATATAIAGLARQLGYPILADPLSQLRSGAHDTGLVVPTYDALLRDAAFAAQMAPEVVLRFGPMPTSKAFSQYAQRHLGARQIVVDPIGVWYDPALSATDIVRTDPQALCRALGRCLPAAPRDRSWCASWLEANRRAAAAIAAQLSTMAELFEGKVFSELAALMPDGAWLYTGSSMPVRDLESFWPSGRRRVRFFGNRGANGIDGFVSSALGAAAVGDTPVVIVTGDLGFYHDLNGLLAVKRHGVRATIIVLNNDGGGIFSFLPQAECDPGFEEFFATPHGLDFRGAVEMYGAAFVRVESWEHFRAAAAAAIGAPRTTVIEVPAVSRARNVVLHRQLWAAASRALATGAH
ncbi:MAG: 2-succinyl-5-enolpyruvyl-6-hydroxy-3-cyclohexene-1-carboxylic-acid synthase [Deltaproteobacteria bacterium]|nr:2-succinyl-5-enolpyruvyl-6-hydroxy-3-cyclohexene-1-carboxylic-acid synthase [Deltaproteobacteria bacterium]